MNQICITDWLVNYWFCIEIVFNKPEVMKVSCYSILNILPLGRSSCKSCYKWQCKVCYMIILLPLCIYNIVLFFLSSHKIYVQLLKMILAKFCVYLYYYIIYSFHTSRSIAFYVISHSVIYWAIQCIGLYISVVAMATVVRRYSEFLRSIPYTWSLCLVYISAKIISKIQIKFDKK